MGVPFSMQKIHRKKREEALKKRIGIFLKSLKKPFWRTIYCVSGDSQGSTGTIAFVL